MMKKIMLTLIVLSVSTWQNAFAQQSAETRNSFAATVNPSFYALGGYSVKGFYHLASKWSFGMALEAGFELPDFARDQFFRNGEDLTVNWDYLAGIEVRYRFNESDLDKGFYVAGTFGTEGWTISDDNGLEDNFDNLYASLGVGYNWYPFSKPNFHLGASYNVVFILNNTDARSVGQAEYNIRGVVPPSIAPTVYLGWRF